jgi:hypothetical protein
MSFINRQQQNWPLNIEHWTLNNLFSLFQVHLTIFRHFQIHTVAHVHDFILFFLCRKSYLIFDLLRVRCICCEIRWGYVWFFHGATAPSVPGSPPYQGFTITLRHTTLGRNPLDEWSAWRKEFYLTTHNTHKRQTSMFPAGFEPVIPAREGPQTHASDGVATGIGYVRL